MTTEEIIAILDGEIAVIRTLREPNLIANQIRIWLMKCVQYDAARIVTITRVRTYATLAGEIDTCITYAQAKDKLEAYRFFEGTLRTIIKTMRIDLHSHTKASDGMSTAEEFVKYAALYKLDAIALTDHHVTMHRESDKVAKALEKAGIVVFRGCEYSSDGGHMLIYGVDIAKLNLGRYCKPQDVINKVNDAGGCVVPSHPFKGYKRAFEAKVAELVDIPAWEGVNGQCCYQVPSANTKAQELSSARHMAITGGSDAHNARILGLAWTEFVTEQPTTDAQLVAALWQGGYTPAFDVQRVHEEVNQRMSYFSEPQHTPIKTKTQRASRKRAP